MSRLKGGYRLEQNGYKAKTEGWPSGKALVSKTSEAREGCEGSNPSPSSY